MPWVNALMVLTINMKAFPLKGFSEIPTWNRSSKKQFRLYWLISHGNWINSGPLWTSQYEHHIMNSIVWCSNRSHFLNVSGESWEMQWLRSSYDPVTLLQCSLIVWEEGSEDERPWNDASLSAIRNSILPGFGLWTSGKLGIWVSESEPTSLWQLSVIAYRLTWVFELWQRWSIEVQICWCSWTSFARKSPPDIHSG